MKRKICKLSDIFLQTPISHRGCHNKYVSENSLEAFKIAKNNNFAIEIDIFRLKDGNFAVFHDKNLKRMTGKDELISNQNLTNLDKLSLWDNQKIPTLDEVFNLIGEDVPLLIELKPEGNFKNEDLSDLLKITDKYNNKNNIAFQTFNPLTARALKKLTANYPVGILSSFNLNETKGLKKYILKSLMLFKYSKADFISYDINYLPNKYVNKLRKNNIQTLAWVVDTKEKLEKSKIYADNIIFENLEILENYGNK